MQNTNSSKPAVPLDGKHFPKSESVPEPITDKLAELYAEYIKPERFFEWVYQQEQLKRKLAEQQCELELQHKQCLAHIERNELRTGWLVELQECELCHGRNGWHSISCLDKQLDRQHLDLRQQHNGGGIEGSSGDGASGVPATN